jgi:hypothetical protein
MNELITSLKTVVNDYWTNLGFIYGEQYEIESAQHMFPNDLFKFTLVKKNIKFIATRGVICGDPFISNGTRVELLGKQIKKDGTPGVEKVIYSIPLYLK